MRRPPRRLRLRTFAVVIALLSSAGPAAAQTSQQPELGVSLMAQAVAGGLMTLVIGGLLIVLAPEYTERTTGRIRETPVEAMLYGLGITILVVIVFVILILTVIGIIVVIPLAIALAVVAELGYLAAGRSVTDDWGPALLVAIGVAAIASGVPILGGLVALVLSSMGVGGAYLDYRDGGDGGADSSVGGQDAYTASGTDSAQADTVDEAPYSTPSESTPTEVDTGTPAQDGVSTEENVDDWDWNLDDEQPADPDSDDEHREDR